MLRHRFHTLLLALICVALGALALAAGSALPLDRGERSVIERWENLDDAQKARLRQRFERYQRMSEAERTEIDERARNLRRLRERVPERLSNAERERLSTLDPARRDEIVDEIVEDELKAQGRRLHALLPEELRERLERADPEERLRFFTEFKEKNRKRVSSIALGRLGRMLGYELAEIQAMQRLSESERMEKVLELRKLMQERAVEEHGLPVGLTPERWETMLALPPEEFFEEVMRIREAGRWPPRRQTASEGDRASVAQGLPFDLLGELRARPAERLELAELPAPERKAELARRRRARIHEVLRERAALPDAALAELEALPDGEFYARLRRMVRAPEPEAATIGR